MRISVTQLETFQECQVKYDYRHRRRIRPTESKESAALSVGRAVAKCLEVGLLSDSPRAAALAKAGRDEKVLRCLRVMPDDIWELGKAAVAEDKMEVPLGRHIIPGIPDLWYVEYQEKVDMHDEDCSGPHGHSHFGGVCPWIGHCNDDRDPYPVAVHVVEFKTTGDPKSKAMQKAIRYEDWGVQVVRYAALLWKNYEWLRDVPFYRRHILLSWHEKANLAYPGRRLLVSGRAMEESLKDMERIADDAERVFEGYGIEDPESLGGYLKVLAPVGPVHRDSPATCGWCEFGPICQAWLKSGDAEYVIETAYQKKEER